MEGILRKFAEEPTTDEEGYEAIESFQAKEKPREEVSEDEPELTMAEESKESKSKQVAGESFGNKQSNGKFLEDPTTKGIDGNKPIDSSSTSAKQEITVEYPEYIEGQRVGAVLQVKHLPAMCSPGTKTSLRVHDHVKILTYNDDPFNGKVRVKNLRTGHEEFVSWDCFFPVPFHGKCGCLQGQGECRCIYESREDFLLHHPCTCTANEPDEAAGQTINSILAVKQHPYSGSHITRFELPLHVDIGDRVQILNFCERDPMKVMGRNLRTKGVGYLRWDAFRCVGVRKMCACAFARCDCEYVDYEASVEFRKT